jgi:hypothetical protein
LKKFEVFAHQNKFIRSKSKFPALVAGYGAGKTVAFVLKALIELGRNPSKVILLAEPTYPMVRDVLQPTLEYAINELGFKYEHSATRGRYRVIWKGGWGDILLRSAENYIRWAGLNLAGFGIDEAALLKDDSAWKMGLGRLREGTHLCAWTTTTPEGFNWHYNYWEENLKDGYEIIRGKTFDNTYLPQEFIDSLLDNYDDRLVRAYLHGEYVNLQYGRTYYSFSREDNVVDELQFDPTLPLLVGMDFNVDPMCGVLWQRHVHEPFIRIFDEVFIRHSDEDDLMTERMCNEIHRRYPNATSIIAYPDPTGKKRGTAHRKSDFDIIRSSGMRIKAKRHSPSITDSVNSVNNAMKWLKINKSCVKLIKDWEQVVNKEGTREIDKSNTELTHMSDAIRYALDIEFPVRKINIKQL